MLLVVKASFMSSIKEKIIINKIFLFPQRNPMNIQRFQKLIFLEKGQLFKGLWVSL